MKPFERTRDKVAIVGFASTTRDKAPWDDPEYEIWIMNEEAHFDWCKRYDRSFQLHPKWNFIKEENPNDPNHWYWLQNKAGVCRRCKGTTKFIVGKEERNCEECDGGNYPLDPFRKDAVIYMQKKYNGIPGAAKYPLKEIGQKFNFQMSYDYFSSTPAYALALAMYMGFSRIEIYGVEMQNDTEYNFQRPNMEYWIGLGRGLGFDIYSSAEKGLLRAELYGYASLKIGYRQDLEARIKMLKNQELIAKTNADRYGGRLAMIEEILEKYPSEELKKLRDEIDAKYREHIGTLNFVHGAQRETKNLTEMYDAHFLSEITGGEDD